MAKIKIKRGLEANIGSITLDDGEFAVTTDTHKLYVGLGGHNICIASASGLGDMLKSVYDVDNDGVVEMIPVAAASKVGGIKVGSNLSVTPDGVLSGNSNPQSYIRKQESFTISNGQTTFNLTKGYYNPGTNSLSWSIYGVQQPQESLIENSSTSFSIPTGLPDGTQIDVEYIQAVNLEPYPPHKTEHLPGGTDDLGLKTIALSGSYNDLSDKPLSLPANGGNSDTVDNKHASDFATAAQGTKADNALPSANYTASDVLSKLKTVDGSGSGVDADTVDGKNVSDLALIGHKYHTFSNGQYFYDTYEQSNYLRLFIEMATFDIIRFCSISDVEYFDGTNWVSWTNGDVEIKKLLDGREETGTSIDHTHRQFRFTVNKSTGWPCLALLAIQSIWTGLTYPGITVTIENWDNVSVWLLRDTCYFDSSHSGSGFGTHLKAISTIHDGYTKSRITISINDWTDNGSYTTIPLRRFMILSNYMGQTLQPWTWNFDKVVDFKNTPTVLGNKIFHTGNDGSGSGFDTDKLDGQEGSYYLSRNNHTGTQTASTISDFASTVLATVLTGLSATTNAVITATDSVLSALGKLQKQISDNLTTLTNHTSNTSNPHSITKSQVGLGNVDNTSDINKPVSIAQQNVLDLKANLSNPILTGTPKAPTATSSDNSTQIATTAFVKAQGYITSAGSGAKITVDSIAPSSPSPGDFWFEVIS